jgi:hypothetical protein
MSLVFAPTNQAGISTDFQEVKMALTSIGMQAFESGNFHGDLLH